jgi:hypothetical protein
MATGHVRRTAGPRSTGPESTESGPMDAILGRNLLPYGLLSAINHRNTLICNLLRWSDPLVRPPRPYKHNMVATQGSSTVPVGQWLAEAVSLLPKPAEGCLRRARAPARSRFHLWLPGSVPSIAIPASIDVILRWSVWPRTVPMQAGTPGSFCGWRYRR